MLEDLIKSNIPLIFVETDEPQRITEFIPETDKDLQGIWNRNCIQYRLGGAVEKIASTNTMESALQYLTSSRKKYLMVLFGEPEYDMLDSMPEYHTLIFVSPQFKDYPGAVKVNLPLPTKEEYLKAFKDKTKLAKECAELSQGMKLKDAKNCYKYSKHTNTDFQKCKILFTKSSFLDIVVTINTFNYVGGAEDFKQWFGKIKHWHKQEAKDFGFPKQKGVILYGQSGTGKSLCASCLGNEAGLPLYRFDFTKVYDQYVGRSEDKIRQALKDIENTAPAIIWIEEIGRLFSGPDIQSNIAHHQVLSILLTWMQECDKDIFIVATANDIKNIPLELVRPGRFSGHFDFKAPNKETRKKIFEIYLKKHGIDFDTEILAERSNIMTGADIEARIQEVVIEAYNKGITKEEVLNQMIKGG
jgi:SpoVK/Ycf46/Vps4 family AAA+-type ATPase